MSGLIDVVTPGPDPDWQPDERELWFARIVDAADMDEAVRVAHEHPEWLPDGFDTVRAYSPDQPRDYHGRFGEGTSAKTPDQARVALRDAMLNTPVKGGTGDEPGSDAGPPNSSMLDRTYAHGEVRGNTDDLGKPSEFLDTAFSEVSQADRGDVKEQIVNDLTGRILEEAKTNEALAAEIAGAVGKDNWHDLQGKGDGSEQYVGVQVQQYVDVWAQTAADTDSVAWALQQTVADEMGAHSDAFNAYVGPSDEPGHDVARDRTGDILASEGSLMGAFVRAEYGRTQEFLADAGIKPDDKVQLYRGMDVGLVAGDPSKPEGWPSAGDSGRNVPIDMNPASSWTVVKDTAERTFGGSHVLTGEIPAKNILSTAFTGRGAFTEGEVLVLNRPGQTAEVQAAPWT